MALATPMAVLVHGSTSLEAAAADLHTLIILLSPPAPLIKLSSAMEAHREVMGVAAVSQLTSAKLLVD